MLRMRELTGGGKEEQRCGRRKYNLRELRDGVGEKGPHLKEGNEKLRRRN